MIVNSDWTITRATGAIRYVGDDHDGASPSYATVIELHRWLQDLADDAVASGDDELDITNVDPSRRSTDNIITLINGYNITDVEAEHIYDGSIIQNDGDDIYDGIVNFGNADVQIQIIQNGVVLADDWWNFGGGGLNPSAAAGISHRFIIKTRDSGSDIDGRRLLGTTRTFGKTYGQFPINGTSRGNNVLALSDAADLNNQTDESTVSGWTGIVLNEGYTGIDVDNNGTPEFYAMEGDRSTYSINQFYERMKWLTRDGSSSTLFGLNGELFRGITHEIDVDNQSATDFSDYEEVTWSGGTGQMLAVDDVNAATKMWIQLLTGVAPTDGQTITGGTSGATCDVNTTVIDRSATIAVPFIGASTGSALIGAYGMGIQVADLSSADKVKDLTNAVITPPNYVTNTVSGLASGEDRVLVAPWDGSSTDTNGDPAITKGQFLLATALTSDNITSVVIKAGTEGPSIPSDTPSSGYLRVTDDNGFERRLHYSSWSGSTFTIDTTDGNEDFGTVNASVDNNIYLAYIDVLASGSTASFTSVQSGSRSLVVVVRDGGVSPIKQFISAWSQTSSPSTISAIRTTDA